MRSSSLVGCSALVLLLFACGGSDPGPVDRSSAGAGGASGGAAGATGATGGSTLAGSAGSMASGGATPGGSGGGAGLSSAGAGFGGSGSSQPSQRIVGYLPTWRGVAEYAPRLASAGLTHVNLAFANPDQGTPTLGISDQDIASLVDAAHASGTQVLISIGGGDGSAAFEPMLVDGNRQSLVDAYVQYIEAHGFDGLDVDLEGDVAMTANYAAFVLDLSAALEPRQKLLTSALGVWFVDAIPDPALAAFDFINVMSYDHCGAWTAPCEQSTYEDAIADLEYFTADRAIELDKLVLGVPFYAWCWGSACPDDALTYGALLELYPNAWQQDWIQEETITLSYNGRDTMLSKVELAKQHGGIMAWELGQDAAGEQSLLALITGNF